MLDGCISGVQLLAHHQTALALFDQAWWLVEFRVRLSLGRLSQFHEKGPHSLSLGTQVDRVSSLQIIQPELLDVVLLLDLAYVLLFNF